MALTAYQVTGTNDATKQVSVTRWNSLMGVLEAGLSTAATRAALAALVPVAGEARYLAESGREGVFVYSGSNLASMVTADTTQAVYVAPSSAPTGASGAWVRKFSGPLNAKWFGAVGDDTTDNSVAFNAALTLAAALGYVGYGYPNGLATPVLLIPAGRYYCSTTLDIVTSTIIEGEGGGGLGSPATLIRFAAGVTGIRVQAHNTSGGSGAAVATTTRGHGSMICRLGMYGGYVAADGEFHGIQMRSPAVVQDVYIQNFAGDGIHIEATAGGGFEGNANLWRVINTHAIQCRNGLKVDGADANAGYSVGFNASSNRQWGIWDSAFLTNQHTGFHVDANGLGPIPSMVSHSGNWYTVVNEQDAGASTNAPSGTTADNAWWIYLGAGGANGSHPAWVTGTTYRAGGAWCTDDANAHHVMIGYTESGQAPAQAAYSTITIGNQYAAVVGGAYIKGGSGNVTTIRNLAVEGTGDCATFGSGASFLRAYSDANGAAMATGASVTGYGFAVQPGSDRFLILAANDYRVACTSTAFTPYSSGGVTLGTAALPFAASHVASVNVGANQVVGAQGAVVADATDAATAITQLNALLARCRTHGLIAT